MWLFKGPKIRMSLWGMERSWLDGSIWVRGRSLLVEASLPPQFFTSPRWSWAKVAASCSASCRQPTFLPVA